MSNNRHDKKAGFTLIELLVYLALVSGVLIVATTFAWEIINSRTKAFAVQEVEQNGRLIMERLIQETHQAVKIAEPQIGTESKQLILSMRDKQNDPISITLQEGQLFLSQADGKPQALSSKEVIVSRLSFFNASTSNDRSHNVIIKFTIDHMNPSNRQEWQASETFSTAVELRD
jgi:prepilin-type N-terminal cleavage/methylation domain-containing protein